jgi:hypothetical protein
MSLIEVQKEIKTNPQYNLELMTEQQIQSMVDDVQEMRERRQRGARVTNKGGAHDMYLTQQSMNQTVSIMESV